MGARVEEPPGGGRVTARGDQHVDDLSVLVDGPVHVSPDAIDPDVGFVDEPAIAWCVADEPGRVGQRRREPLHPPVHRDVVDLDPTLGKELFDIAVGEPEA